jgi:DNA-3-methyladenine glycosylase I
VRAAHDRVFRARNDRRAARHALDGALSGGAVRGLPARAAVALSKDLKKLGWRFVGPTTVYAFMQAMGLVNDHVADCVVRSRVERAREAFERPQQ